jgi:hypothetical protein
MTDSTNKPDPAEKAPSILHEADIGSGERSPGQNETDQMIRDIPKRGEGNRQDAGETGSKEESPKS